MDQQAASTDIIKQIINVTSQLDNEQFMQPLQVLSGNTYGKHVRHVIEFYNCLLAGHQSGVVNYDARAHNPLIETNKFLAIDELNAVLTAIIRLEDKPMLLKTDYSGTGNFQTNNTSYNRELVYNLEHAIHHMAIIKIAVQNCFPQVLLPENFGVAYSTVRYLQKQCAQ
jgi:uncharacterized damage-inducible protein DinB